MGKKGAETRQLIMNTAQALILDHGYGGTSVDQIINMRHELVLLAEPEQWEAFRAMNPRLVQNRYVKIGETRHLPAARDGGLAPSRLDVIYGSPRRLGDGPLVH